MHHQRNACAASTYREHGPTQRGNELGGATRLALPDILRADRRCRVTIAGLVPGAELHAAARLADGAVTFGDKAFSTSRSMATAPINSAYQVMVVSPPAQHDEFGAEARAPSRA